MIKYTATLENLHRFIEYARTTAVEAGFKSGEIDQIELALEEWLVNIINYSFPNGGGEVCLECSLQDSFFVITLSDDGIPFNPLEKADPDISVPVDEREIGGLGIFLIKNLMDEVAYRYENGYNKLTLKKKKGD